MKHNRLLSITLILFLVAPLCAFDLEKDCKADEDKIKVYYPFPRPPADNGILLCRAGSELIDIFEYLHKNKGSADLNVIETCCVRSLNRNCMGHLVSRFDGNTLTLAAAETGNLAALEYFATEIKYEITDGATKKTRQDIKIAFKVDDTWRNNRAVPQYSIVGRSELMHAIANDDLAMVTFLLSKGKDPVDYKGFKVDGEKTRYSDPMRVAPHPDPKYHFNHDALDFACWHRGAIQEEIITIIHEAWEEEAKNFGGKRRPLTLREEQDKISKTRFGHQASADIKPWIFDIQRMIDSSPLDFRKIAFPGLFQNNFVEKYLSLIKEKPKAKPAGKSKAQSTSI